MFLSLRPIPIRQHKLLSWLLGNSIPRRSRFRTMSTTRADPVLDDQDIKMKQEMAAQSKAPPVFRHPYPESQSYSPLLDTQLQRLEAFVDWERRSRSAGAQRLMKVDNRSSRDLLHILGNPHKTFQSIHVTGSKGKGSVTCLLEHGLMNAGYKTGWFRSPHVERINERVGILGKPIDDDDFAECLHAALDAHSIAVSQTSPASSATWFDILTAAGMKALAKQKVDYAVVEVGMGGYKDSTNVLEAPFCVITNVYLEHADIIGPLREDIAREKVGIVHSGSTLVTGVSQQRDPAIYQILHEHCQQVGAKKIVSVDTHSLCSNFDANLAMARAVLDEMNEAGKIHSKAARILDDDQAKSALKTLPARMEMFAIQNKAVQVVLDGAHVPESVDMAVLQSGKVNESSSALMVVLGVGKDKDAMGIVKAVLKHVPSHLICTQAGPQDPYLKFDKLESIAKAMATPTTAVCSEQDPLQAMHLAINLAKPNSTIVVTGSLHLAGRIRPLLRALATTERIPGKSHQT